MQDIHAYFEKLHQDAIDCALIAKHATDPQKREMFDRLADHLAILASQLEHVIEPNPSTAHRKARRSDYPEAIRGLTKLGFEGKIEG